MKTILVGTLSPKFMGLNINMTSNGLLIRDLKTFLELLKPYNGKNITLTVDDGK